MESCDEQVAELDRAPRTGAHVWQRLMYNHVKHQFGVHRGVHGINNYQWGIIFKILFLQYFHGNFLINLIIFITKISSIWIR
jgi:hypothetical protein